MKILMTGAVNWSAEHFSKIKELGHDIVFVQDERIQLSEQGFNESEFDGVICNALFLYTNIEKFTKLKFIQLTSAGYDRVPMDYINKKGIKIFNARGVYSIPMSEFALNGVLQLYKQSKFFYKNQANKIWQKNRELIELYDKNVCIVGCGSVGNECAKRFTAFGCKVSGVDLFVRQDNLYNTIYPLEKLKEQIGKNDIVVLTLPLTSETKNLFNKEMLLKMKKDSVLVNISRGAVVDETSLIEVLKTHLLGAVLDVFETEPLDTKSPLWELENVIITPHNSFVSKSNIQRLFNLIVENLKGAL